MIRIHCAIQDGLVQKLWSRSRHEVTCTRGMTSTKVSRVRFITFAPRSPQVAKNLGPTKSSYSYSRDLLNSSHNRYLGARSRNAVSKLQGDLRSIVQQVGSARPVDLSGTMARFCMRFCIYPCSDRAALHVSLFRH